MDSDFSLGVGFGVAFEMGEDAGFASSAGVEPGMGDGVGVALVFFLGARFSGVGDGEGVGLAAGLLRDFSLGENNQLQNDFLRGFGVASGEALAVAGALASFFFASSFAGVFARGDLTGMAFLTGTGELSGVVTTAADALL